MLKNHLTVDASIALIIIMFLDFFSLTLLPDDSILRFPATFAAGMMLVVIFVKCIVEKGIVTHPLDKLVVFFIASMMLSSFMSYIYWDQSFFSSVKSYSYFYIYFLYFALIYVNISAQRVERIIIVLFFLSLLIFLIDFVTFPDPLFAWRDEERRNGITVFFYGQGFTFLGGFYYLGKYFDRRKIIDLIWWLLSFVCLFLLTQSRQNLIALVLGFFLLLFTSKLRRKISVAIFVIIAFGIFYSSTGLFTGIEQETKTQAKSYSQDIRVLSQEYFLTELQGGVPTIFLGNGIPGKDSRLMAESIKGSSRGFFISDVGLTAIFSYFGLFSVIIWLLFFYHAFKMQNTPNSNYLKAYFLVLLTTAFTGYSIFEPGYMPATILALYLVRLQNSVVHKTVYYISH